MDKKTLDALERKGEAVVLNEMAQGEHGSFDSPHRHDVEVWLRSKALAREVETLSIAAKARSEARIANIIATVAILLSGAIVISQWL